MKIKAKLTFTYGNDKIASNVLEAVRIDDGTFIESKRTKHMIKATLESDNLSSFLQTIDDYLSCLAVAENIIKSKKEK